MYEPAHAILNPIQDSFDIFEGIDGSATSYTITYTNSMVSGEICGSRSATILASSCGDNGMCNHTFNVTSSSLQCPFFFDLSVTVFATNPLGNGPVSSPIKAGIYL